MHGHIMPSLKALLYYENIYDTSRLSTARPSPRSISERSKHV